jgi:hypothetical protein
MRGDPYLTLTRSRLRHCRQSLLRRGGRPALSGPGARVFGFHPISNRFPLNLIAAAENKEMGRAFDNTHCRYEVRFMSSLALREDIRPATATPGISTSARPASRSKPANASLEGILLFSGIGLGLVVLAAIFSYLELPPPYF